MKSSSRVGNVAQAIDIKSFDERPGSSWRLAPWLMPVELGVEAADGGVGAPVLGVAVGAGDVVRGGRGRCASRRGRVRAKSRVVCCVIFFVLITV